MAGELASAGGWRGNDKRGIANGALYLASIALLSRF